MADLASVAKVILTAEDKTGAAFQSVNNAVDGLHSKLTGLVAGGVAALGAALTINAFSGFIGSAIESAAAIQNLHEKTGLGVDALTTLRSAAKLADTDLQSIVPAILKLEQNMVKAAGGSQEMSAAFESLGVDVREASGALREPDAVLLDLAKKFEDMGDGAAKTGLAMQIFGKQGANMIPVLHELALKGEYVTKVTKQQAEAADDYQKNLVRMEGAANQAKNAIGNALIPAMDAISQVMLETVTSGGGLRQMLLDLVADGSIASWAQTGVIWIARVADIVANVLGLFKAMIITVVDVAKGMMQFANVLEGVRLAMSGNADGMKLIKQGWEGMKDVGSHIAETWATATTRTTNFEDAAVRAVLRVSEMGNESDRTGKKVTDFGKAHKEAADAVQGLVDKLEEERGKLQSAVDSMERYGVKATASKQAQVELEIQQGKFNTTLASGTKVFDAHAQSLAAKALAEAKEIDILTALKAIYEKAIDTAEKYNESLTKSVEDIYKQIEAEKQKAAAIDGGATSVINYKIAFEQAYQTTAELSRQEVAASNARIAALEKLRNIVADTAALQDAIKYQKQHSDELGKSVEAIEKEIAKVQECTDTIGLSKSAMIDYRIAQEKLKLGVMELSAEETKAIELRIEGLEKLKGKLDTQEARQREIEGWKSFWTDIANAGANFIVDFVAHGSSAFKNLWQDFKTWALEALAKVAAQQIVVSIAGNFGAPSAAAASSLFGGTGFLGNLLGNGGSNTSAAGPVQPSGIFSTVSGIGSMFGGSMGAFGAGLTSPLATIGTFATEGLAAAGGIAGILGAAIPVLGIALAAGSLFGLFGKNSPAQRAGTFGSNEGLGAGNPLFRSSSQFGSFGIFDDKWFSDKDQGQAIQQFLAGIAQVDNAIASIIDEPTLARVRANLATATTTFTAGMEHEASTFGDVVKDRYHTVVDAIDPELTHLVDGFKGTSDELGKFVVDILSVRQTLQTFNSEDLFGQIVTVDDIVDLQHAGESVSQTFTRVVSEFTLTNAIAAQMGQNVGTAFGEVGLASEGARADLIKLMGGMNAAASAFQNYLNVAFTDAERQTRSVAAGMQTLNSVFGDLGVAVPHTWEEFNQLVASLDLSTDAGRAAYAMLMTRGVPAMVAVYGSAQDMANAANGNSRIASRSSPAKSTTSRSNSRAINQAATSRARTTPMARWRRS
jgi:hypothetical protein